MSESNEGWAERRAASPWSKFQARLELLAGWAGGLYWLGRNEGLGELGGYLFSFQRVLDVDLRFCHTLYVTSLLQTGSGMISAYTDRCRPGGDE
jgi:hypothetical protein